MTRYSVHHVTHFAYDAPVSFVRCNLRLRPIPWPGQKLISHTLTITPDGMIRPVHLDGGRPDGGLAHVDRLVVSEKTNALTITSTAEMEIDRLIPLVESDDPCVGDIRRLARNSTDISATSPANFLFPSPMVPLDADIAAWCAASLAPDRPILEAGIDLATRIQRDFAFDPHATITGTPPAQAFKGRSGVCQDFAHIMISGLRAAGLAAAYASGYLRTLPPPGQERLVGADAMHAWVMLWCGPERGWIGLDPTNAILMGNDHIIVAIGRDYSDVTPVDGVLTGYGTQNVHVSVDVVPLEM